jgi:hypothetical protein
MQEKEKRERFYAFLVFPPLNSLGILVQGFVSPKCGAF